MRGSCNKQVTAADDRVADACTALLPVPAPELTEPIPMAHRRVPETAAWTASSSSTVDLLSLMILSLISRALGLALGHVWGLASAQVTDTVLR